MYTHMIYTFYERKEGVRGRNWKFPISGGEISKENQGFFIN